jgi:cytochrome P450
VIEDNREGTAASELDQAGADALVFEAILTDEGRQNPYDIYDRLRTLRPRHRSAAGATVVTGYADGLELLRSPKWGRPEPDMEESALFPNRRERRDGPNVTMLFLNPPEHTRIRAPFSRTFTPKRVEGLRANVRSLLEPILEELRDSEAVDVMSRLAIPLPVAVISELIGVPREESRSFKDLVRDATANIDPAADEAALDRADAAIAELAAYFVELIGHKQQHPDDRLLSALVETMGEPEGLSIEELVANILLLYAAGFETTSNLIGNGLRALLLHPDQMAALRADGGLIPSAVLEMLRWDSPVQINGRTALTRTDLFGETVERGQATMILQGAGNHDPAVYEDPRSFEVARFVPGSVPQPLSFGWGAHHCLGAHLARAEAEEVFNALLENFSAISAVGDPPRYRPSATLRGLESFEVAFQV